MKDPKFVEDLDRKTRSGEDLGPLPDKIYRRKHPQFFKKALKRSLFVHLCLLVAIPFLLYLLSGLFVSKEKKIAQTKKKLYRQSIRVDVVDLPSKKISKLKNVNVSAKVVSKKKKKLKIKADPLKKTTKKIVKKSKKKPLTKVKSVKKEEKLDLEALREKIRRESDLADGARSALAGNILSKGANIEGELAGDVDAYQGMLLSHIRRFWQVPGWVQSAGLKAKVLVKVAADGRMLSRVFSEKSGSEEFDQLVEDLLERANPLPKPPLRLQKVLLEEGIEWAFPE